MLLRQRLSCATQLSASAWFQRENACSTSPLVNRSLPTPPNSGATGRPKKPAAPIFGKASAGHHSSASIRGARGASSLRANLSAVSSTSRCSADSSKRSCVLLRLALLSVISWSWSDGYLCGLLNYIHYQLGCL